MHVSSAADACDQGAVISARRLVEPHMRGFLPITEMLRRHAAKYTALVEPAQSGVAPPRTLFVASGFTSELYSVQRELQDVMDAVNVYKIAKSDASSPLSKIMRTRFQHAGPGGPPWASILSLELQVEDKKDHANPEFDRVIDGMHSAQLAMFRELERFLDINECSEDEAPLNAKDVHVSVEPSSAKAQVHVDLSMVPLPIWSLTPLAMATRPLRACNRHSMHCEFLKVESNGSWMAVH